MPTEILYILPKIWAQFTGGIITCPWVYTALVACMPVPDVRMEHKKSPSEMNTTKWCITYWLTEGRTLDTFNELVKNMPEDWHLEGQIEQGTDSQQKLHAQIFLKTPKTRGTKIVKYFPHCYIAEARNPFALQKYVHKEETRVAEIMTVENRSPQWQVVRDKFFEWVVNNEPFYAHIKDDMDERISPRLDLWDRFITLSIAEGMNVELVGVNPQYRSAVRRYWSGFVSRAEQRLFPDNIRGQEQNKEQKEESPPPIVVKMHAAEGGVVRRVKNPE